MQMNQDSPETPVTWVEEHPWLAQISAAEDEDSIDEVIRYTLDEIRYA